MNDHYENKAKCRQKVQDLDSEFESVPSRACCDICKAKCINIIFKETGKMIL